MRNTLTPPFYRVAQTLANGGTQDVQDQARAGQEAASESLHSSVDAHEDRQHYQIQLQAEDVAQNEAGSMSRKSRDFASLGDCMYII